MEEESYILPNNDDFYMGELNRSFYDGNGRYSKKTQDFVKYYLSQKDEYNARSTVSMNNNQLAQVLSEARSLPGPNEEEYLRKSLSMKDINARIKQTIGSKKRPWLSS